MMLRAGSNGIISRWGFNYFREDGLCVKRNHSVTNGGFAVFYHTSYSIFAPEIIHVLNKINAVATSEIVNGSLSEVIYGAFE